MDMQWALAVCTFRKMVLGVERLEVKKIIQIDNATWRSRFPVFPVGCNVIKHATYSWWDCNSAWLPQASTENEVWPLLSLWLLLLEITRLQKNTFSNEFTWLILSGTNSCFTPSVSLCACKHYVLNTDIDSLDMFCIGNISDGHHL